MNRLLFMLCFTCLLLPACHKKAANSSIAIDADLVKDFDYKVGTYWVYKDSATGLFDSVYITGSDSIPFPDSYSALFIYFNNTATPNYHAGITLLANGFALSFPFPKELKYNDPLQDSIYEYENLFSYPLIQGPMVPGTGDIGTVETVSTTIQTGNNSFNNVAVLNHLSSQPGYDYHDRFYLSRDAGIIKMVFNHASDSFYQVLELQRWKIVK